MSNKDSDANSSSNVFIMTLFSSVGVIEFRSFITVGCGVHSTKRSSNVFTIHSILENVINGDKKDGNKVSASVKISDPICPVQ